VGAYEASEFGGGEAAIGVAVSGDYAYVIDGVLGLYAIEVSDPTAPRRVGGNTAIGGAFGGDVTVVGDKVFVLAGERGFVVLELWKPFPPTRVVALGGEREVELSWSAPAGGLAPVGYDIHQLSPGPRAKVNREPVAGTSFAVTGLESGVEHCFVVQSVSSSGERSDDSAPAACGIAGGGTARFRRGDSNGDGGTNLADAVYTLNYLFLGGTEPECLEAADDDDNGTINLTDPVRLLNYLFLGGPAPPAPGPGPGDCGEDPAGSPNLGCRSYARC
jgi:hypothetical protein